MTKYSIYITTIAERQFKKLHKTIQDRIASKILSLESHSRPFGSHKLFSSDNYRIRIGDYRVIYYIDDSKRIIKVLDIAHRSTIYR